MATSKAAARVGKASAATGMDAHSQSSPSPTPQQEIPGAPHPDKFDS